MTILNIVLASDKATVCASNVATQQLKCTHRHHPQAQDVQQQQSDTPSPSTDSPCTDDGPNLLVNSSWNSTDAKILLVPSFQSCCELCWETQGCTGFAYFTHNWGRGVYKECSQTSYTTASNLNAQAPESATGYFR